MSSVELKKIDRLRQFAEAQFGSVSKMSLAMGRTTGYFGTYISKGVLPKYRILKELEGLGLNLDWLMTGQGEMLRSTSAVAEPPSAYVAYTLEAVWDGLAELHPPTPKWRDLDDATKKSVMFAVTRSVVTAQEHMSHMEDGPDEQQSGGST